MALSQIYTAVAGHIITAARWNNEFGNIYTNGVDLAFPVTKAVSFAGYTITLDVSGVSTLTSPSTTGFLFTVGNKSGAPSVSGGLGSFTTSTFTDSSTAAAGTAALWCGFSVRTPTLAASAAGVITTDAATVYIEGPPTAGTNQTFTEASALLVDGKLKTTGDIRLRGIDARTNSIVEPMTVQMMTSGTPAAGIGTGIAFAAESADEAPSNLGTLDFAFSDVTAASEDSYMRIKLRVAGAALTEAYRWLCTTAFSGIFTHANTADRTYTLPDFSVRLIGGAIYSGPSSSGTGSTRAVESTTTYAADAVLSGVHFYNGDVTLNSTKTLTVAANGGRLCLIATGTITINGTIDAIGAGGLGGTAQLLSVVGSRSGGPGTSQPGGGGGGGNVDVGADGGFALPARGGLGGAFVTAGAQGQDNTGEVLGITHPLGIYGGGGGGGGGSSATGNAGAGGAGGGGVILVAPSIVLGASSAIKTSGVNGTAGGATNGGGGGGGSAGNYHAFCITYTDSGCTFTQTAGTGGAGNGTGGGGAAGRAGIKQILIYA